VRELAREYGVDAKVISLAYRVLSGEGLVELRARSGAFVAKPSALATPRSSRDWLVDALVEARRRGISPRKAIEFVATATTSAPMRALIIDRNRDQLWSMSRELEADYGCATESLDLGDGSDHETTLKLKEAVKGVDLIVTTAYERRRVKALVRECDVPLCAVTMCSELFAEVRRLLSAQPVYFVVADTRFADKLHDLFSSATGRPNLRVLVHGRDELDVPASAPVYLTRLVRHLLDGRHFPSLLERGMPEARVFSDETARELTNLLISTGDRDGRPSRIREM
jgi:hypothetical protein